MPSSIKAGIAPVIVNFQFIEANLIANTTLDLIAPCDGYIDELGTAVDKAITTGGTLTVKTGDTLATTQTGLTQTIANAAAKGARQRTSSTAPSSTRKVSKGDRIGIIPAGFASAGNITGYLTINPAQADKAAGF